MLEHCKESDRFVTHKHMANYFLNKVRNFKEVYNHFVKVSEIFDIGIDTYLSLGTLSLK